MSLINNIVTYVSAHIILEKISKNISFMWVTSTASLWDTVWSYNDRDVYTSLIMIIIFLESEIWYSKVKLWRKLGQVIFFKSNRICPWNCQTEDTRSSSKVVSRRGNSYPSVCSHGQYEQWTIWWLINAG